MSSDGENSRALIAELELKLREEKQRYQILKAESEVAGIVARQEVDQYKRYYLALKEIMDRLDEDYSLLKERELKGQEKIRDLMVEIERKEEEFKEKLEGISEGVRGFSEWKRKYEEEVERREREVAELFDVNRELARALSVYSKSPVRKEDVGVKLLKGVEDAGKVDDEMPVRSDEGIPFTPVKTSKWRVVRGDEDDEDDWRTLSQLKRKKRSSEGFVHGGKTRVRSSKVGEGSNAKTQSSVGNKALEVSNDESLFLLRNKDLYLIGLVKVQVGVIKKR